MKSTVLAAVILFYFSAVDSNRGDVLTSTVTAISNLLQFYKNSYDKSVNLDAIFGLRVIEGQLKLLVEDFERDSSKFSFSTASEVFVGLKRLSGEATKVANMAIPYLVEQDPKYFELLKYLVQEPWKVSRPHRFINHNLAWTRRAPPPGSVPEMSEKVSDKCLAELTGARNNDKPCQSITEDCLQKFLQPQQFWYTLQHQVLYTVVAQKMGCDKTIDEYITAANPESLSVDHVQHVFCTNALLDLEDHVARSGGIEPHFRDLFLEIQFVCPSIGFFQFLRLEWLREILEWQSPLGCFPNDTEPFRTKAVTTEHAKTARLWHESETGSDPKPIPRVAAMPFEPRKQIPVPVVQQKSHGAVAHALRPVEQPVLQLSPQVSHWGTNNGFGHLAQGYGQVPLNSQHPTANGWYQGNRLVEGHWAPHRGLKSLPDPEAIIAYHDNGVSMPRVKGLGREKTLEGGCMAHFTCVAAGALSMYLRYLLDPGPPEFSQHGLVNTWMASHQPKKPVDPKAPEDHRTPAVPRMSGTYQRRWELPAVSTEDRVPVDDGLPSYVHRSGIRKDLADRAFLPRRNSTTDEELKESEEEKETRLSSVQAEVHRLNLQSDLSHYLIIVTIVSLGFICLLFKYIYKRRMHFKNRLWHI